MELQVYSVQLTLESDYAIRIIYIIADGCRPDGSKRMDAKAISEISGVPLRFSLKILRKLVAGGLVRSYKGMRGGYQLAKEPQEISILDVVELTEGPININRCVSGDFVCTRVKDSPCQFQRRFDEVSQTIRSALKDLTFDKFLE